MSVRDRRNAAIQRRPATPPVEPTPTPAQSTAISILQSAPDERIADLIQDVESAGVLFDPVTRQRVAAAEVVAAIHAMIPQPFAMPADVVTTYHATDPTTAALFIRRGFIPETKPRNLGAEYAPGRGLERGLYVGHTPRSVEGYGRVTLEVKTPLSALAVPWELAQLGTTDPLQALREHDGAVLVGGIPPTAFRVVGGLQYM